MYNMRQLSINQSILIYKLTIQQHKMIGYCAELQISCSTPFSLYLGRGQEGCDCKLEIGHGRRSPWGS